MLSARAAASLLASSHSVDALAPLTATLGFAPPAPLDSATRAALGVPDAASDVRVARGPGALRALLLDFPTSPGGALRDAVARTAARLSARSPHLLWLLAATEQRGPHTVIAAWSADRTPPRVAALLVDRRAVVDSDAETLRSLAAAPAPRHARPHPPADDLLTHSRWLDLLGRGSLTRSFYRTLERLVGTLADSLPHPLPLADRRELALLQTSRLLFLSFLEAKGWLAGDNAFLAHAFDDATARGRAFHRHVLLPLFFGTLNTRPASRAPTARAFGRIPYLNGGLFARTPLERRFPHALLPDDTLGLLFSDLLGRYRFTAREDSAAWTEAAIDPEMLGRAFESLMAPPERQSSGAFYTPQPLVAEVTALALQHALAAPHGPPDGETVAALLAHGPPPDEPTRLALRRRLADLRVLDPACGSGAFLVHALERLAHLATTLGDPRPTAEIRRALLTRSIFGVDVNPTAVWLCELRLWLSVVIESDETDPRRVPPLPNLDRHVRVGDSLAGGAFSDVARFTTDGRRLATLRDRYARASGPRKRTLGRLLEREERRRALATLDSTITSLVATRRDILASLRDNDLFGRRPRRSDDTAARLADLRASTRRLRALRTRVAQGAALPFSFTAHFADAAAAGGFDVVLGNPPWVRLHHIPPASRDSLRRDFRTFRDAPWRQGARSAHAGLGFAAQVDLATLFVERAHSLLKPAGVLALLVPAKLWRSLAAGGVRTLLRSDAALLAVEDWSDSHHTFDAAVYPSLCVARRRTPRVVDALAELEPLPAPGGDDADRAPVHVAVRRGHAVERWTIPARHLPFDTSPGAPWLLLPPEARRAFDRLTAAGTPLAASRLGRPHLGVKCGCNEAFLVDVGPDRNGALARVTAADGRNGTIERALLRPLLRGESVAPWRTPRGSEHIVWTLDRLGRPLAALPPYTERWLAPWRRRLAERSDALARPSARTPWWTLFRADGADCSAARVAWSDLARSPRASVLQPGDPTVPLNSCYVASLPSLDDALAFAALLNSTTAAAWLDALAEPARGGYKRYMGWTVSLLPIPSDWGRARLLLAPLAAAALHGLPPSPHELDTAVAEAFSLAPTALAPLLAWTAR